ncbi:MAG: hypothetical protein L0Y44_15635 [Phycisphaerales bacterium]|nr:hypothetical protein [Phycisphaerales bacterium]MCI0632077.1 hypothetical protein [Phycisphaerales bacterium]MCI0676367.1 hypothetical protein [Phycisphaerales bacterium]
MRTENARLAMAIGCVLACAPAAMAGPNWKEVDDAGALPSSAQIPTGIGSLKCIKGSLSISIAGPSDFEDMYLIYIPVPANFCAKTVATSFDCCGNPHSLDPNYQTLFDTQLWLFKATDEKGVLGNDDDPLDPPRSFFEDQANDLMGTQIPAPGFYYLAISGGRHRDPQSAGGAIFFQATPIEVSSPDGPGGGLRISAWAGVGEVGAYQINLCGAFSADAAPIPTVSEWGKIMLMMLLLASGVAVILRTKYLSGAVA